MQEEKHLAALREVKETIDEALNDPRGLLPRQRRLMAALSLGIQHLVELWLHRMHAMKPGACIKHDWFAAEERRIRLRMAGVLTKDIRTIRGADKIFAMAREIEAGRNDIIYGAPLNKDMALREKLEYFLELKNIIEKGTGEIKWD